jgi:hypothetical protein
MVNTMEDLRREVASRLRNSLHGREIDMMEHKPRLPHMLGVTPLREVHDPNNEEMTLLDTKHPFWQDFEGDARTRSQVTEKIETAIRSLREDDIFRMTYPYGQEADIIYVEVDPLTESSSWEADCHACNSTLSAEPSLERTAFTYTLKFNASCDCGFEKTYKTVLEEE